MFSSVAHKTDVAVGSVEYPENDGGSRCAVSTGVLHASGCNFPFVSCRGVSSDGVSV